MFFSGNFFWQKNGKDKYCSMVKPTALPISKFYRSNSLISRVFCFCYNIVQFTEFGKIDVRISYEFSWLRMEVTEKRKTITYYIMLKDITNVKGL